MLLQSYCRALMNSPANREKTPDFIILDVGSQTREFIKCLRKQDHYLFSEELHWIDLVMQSMQYERDSLLELAYSLMAEIDAALGTPEPSKDVKEITNAVMKFGTQVHEQLCQLQIYRNGYLHYQFVKWLGDDMVLQRVCIEPENGD